MSNKTFIPAFQCRVGDWTYYICTMKYGEVARQVQFAHELGSNKQLKELIQRGISERTSDISKYLLNSKHRFLGALVVAAHCGEPTYTKLGMEDPDGILGGLDKGFGVLTFDGTQAYFVLDGQHRLKAIKDAILQNPELAKDDICVIIVTHYETPEGRQRTRRLFSNINRNAKTTAASENIALDEDDGFNILTRRLIEDHPFLSQENRVRVIIKSNDDGVLKLAGGSVNKSDKDAFTTIMVLNDLIRALGWDLPGAMHNHTLRPNDEILDNAFSVLSGRINDLLTKCGNLKMQFEQIQNAKEIRSPRNREGEGHPFMRPAIQKAVVRTLSTVIQKRKLNWEEALDRLAKLDWKLASPPWISVYSADGAKMRVGKENTDLLSALLEAHLAPSSVQEIKRARKMFKDLNNITYPISEDEMAKNLVEKSELLTGDVRLPAERSDSSEEE